MVQLFQGQGVLEGVMAGRQREAALASEQAQAQDLAAQARLRNIQTTSAMMDLDRAQKTEKTLAGLYADPKFSQSPLDRQLEVLGQTLMPIDPDAGMKAFDKSNLIKKERMAQEQAAQQRQTLSGIFAGSDPDKIATSPNISPEMLDKAAQYYAGYGMNKEAATYIQRADEMRKTRLQMQEAEPKLRKMQAETDHYEAETDALRAKQQHGGLTPNEVVQHEDALRKDAESVTKPVRTTLSKVQSVRALLTSDSPASGAQVRQGLVGLFDDIRATNVLYKDNARFGDMVDRGAQAISSVVTGEMTNQQREYIGKMLDDMQNNLLEPKLNEYNDYFKKIATDRGFDSSHVIMPERRVGAGEQKPAPKKAGPLSPIQEDWISRAMKANPGMSRADIIAEGKKRGKL